ncbi:glycosyltransferase [Microbacterium gorillae]|uniref:glycosyltransferase n=1 Tax=Microbacterium gorillae TaxID=1231063 RepID=UPI000AD394F6|nr:glycosyltransferase [Microbacterium gorillae]
MIPDASKHLTARAAGCFVLASRLIPDLDGGFARAVLARAADLRAAGVDAVLLTVDPGSRADHDAHRAEFVRRGALAAPELLRNLFDEAVADPAWLRAAAKPGERAERIEYRQIIDADGRVILELPVIAGNPDWHLSEAAVVVHAADGAVAGVLAGFGGLYRAWLSHVIGSDEAVVLVEARQLGELLVDWDSSARLVHTVHTSHLGAPYTPDAPMLPLWQRFFDVAGRYDAVLWPTARQRDDVIARFGADRVDAVVPNGVALVDTPRPAAERSAHRAVMVNRLAPGKRIDHALRVWRRVVDELPDAVLDIYGEGPARAEIERHIDELGLSESVVLHGVVADPDAVLDDPAVLLLTTAYEGQGLAVLEALAHGTPVISYDVRYGPSASLASGGGVLVPSGDEDAFAAAVLRVLRDDELRTRLSVEAFAAAAENARPVQAQRLLAAIDDVLSHPRRR